MPRTWDEATFQAKLAAFKKLPDAPTALALAEQGDERAFEAVVQASVDYMEGPDAVTYREAMRTLATPALLERWFAKDEAARRTAALALTAREPAHVPFIARALKDADAAVRAIARRALASWRRGDAFHALCRDLLAHEDARVRALAADALGAMGDLADGQRVRDALAREDDARARGFFEDALKRLGG